MELADFPIYDGPLTITDAELDHAIAVDALMELAEELGATVNDLGYAVFPTEGDCVAFCELLEELGCTVVDEVDASIAFEAR